MHVVGDQEHSDCAVPRYQCRTELVWRFVMPTVHARTVGIVACMRISILLVCFSYCSQNYSGIKLCRSSEGCRTPLLTEVLPHVAAQASV